MFIPTINCEGVMSTYHLVHFDKSANDNIVNQELGFKKIVYGGVPCFVHYNEISRPSTPAEEGFECNVCNSKIAFKLLSITEIETKAAWKKLLALFSLIILIPLIIYGGSLLLGRGTMHSTSIVLAVF